MKKYYKKIVQFLKPRWERFSRNYLPGKNAIQGATLGIFIAFALAIIISTFIFLNILGWGPVSVMTIGLILISFLGAYLGVLMLRLLNRIPFWLAVALVSGIPGIMMFFHLTLPGTLTIFSSIALFSGLLAGALWKIKKRWKNGTTLRRILISLSFTIGLSGIALGLIWILHPGKPVEMPPNAAAQAELPSSLLNLPDPSAKGTYQVKYLSYGSGEDKRRKEFGEEAAFITKRVDGSKFLDSWKGFGGKMRTRYFGYDAKALPLNAHVWYPDGDGPFPLVLIVHGNHLAQDFSDPGYAYLGELLASRGYIIASVDQNFLNGSYANFSSGLSTENDARGWILLKHLELWKQWTADKEHPFFGLADMENIALIGHSRGGEAVAHAALFNQIPYYPDNANETFDFNFNIKSLIAIAPSDGQYKPSNTLTPLTNINYLVLQGSHDSDVSSYMGMKQFNRITFTGDYKGFKAGLYIWAANHGQFNSVWGRKDGSSPRINLFNLGQLMPVEEQQTIARVYISAFLDATLKGESDYQPLFMDHRVARHWLPKTVYVSQYEQAGTQMVATFEEDYNLATASLPGSKIQTADLSIWKEQNLSLQWGNYESRMVVLGWNTSQSDTLQPCYQISWPAGALKTHNRSVLVFAMADTGEKADPPGKKDTGKEDDNTGDNGNEEDQKENKVNTGDEENGEEDTEPVFIDFTIRLADKNGTLLEFPLIHCSPLQPRLKRQLTKLKFMQKAAESENILQFFYFPLQAYSQTHPDFDFHEIVSISFLFDQTNKGVVAINNIGFQ